MFKLFRVGKFKDNKRIYSVADGYLIPLERVPDDVFSQKLVGDGVAIEITGDTIVSPCNGQITMLFPTLHAFGIKCSNGIEILVHIGLDTVKLNGQGFTQLANLNSIVKAGDPVIKVNREFLMKNGYQPIVMIIITNEMGYKIGYSNNCMVKKGISIIASY